MKIFRSKYILWPMFWLKDRLAVIEDMKSVHEDGTRDMELLDKYSSFVSLLVIVVMFFGLRLIDDNLLGPAKLFFAGAFYIIGIIITYEEETHYTQEQIEAEAVPFIQILTALLVFIVWVLI